MQINLKLGGAGFHSTEPSRDILPDDLTPINGISAFTKFFLLKNKKKISKALTETGYLIQPFSL